MSYNYAQTFTTTAASAFVAGKIATKVVTTEAKVAGRDMLRYCQLTIDAGKAARQKYDATYKIVHSHLTSPEAMAFYSFVKDICLMVALICKLGIETVDQWIEDCQHTPEAARELREWQKELDEPKPTLESQVEPIEAVEALAMAMVALADVTPDEVAEEVVTYSDMNSQQLRKLCVARGFKGAGRWNKQACLEALQA